MGAVAREAGIPAGPPDRGPDPFGWARLDHAGEITARMRGSVVCFMAPATFLTSLGLIEAAMTRTSAIAPPTTGAATCASSRTEGSPKASNRMARMTCYFVGFDCLLIKISANKLMSVAACAALKLRELAVTFMCSVVAPPECHKSPDPVGTPVCTENLIRVDNVTEPLKLS
jgi:hypothetical protein